MTKKNSKENLTIADAIRSLNIGRENIRPEAPEGSWRIIGTVDSNIAIGGIGRKTIIRNDDTMQQTMIDKAGRTWYPTKKQAANEAITMLVERPWLIDIKLVQV